MKKIFLNIALTALITLLPACNGKAARTESASDSPQLIAAPIANPGSLRAVEQAKEYVRSNPENAEAHYRLGTAYFDAFMYEDAVKANIKAIRINPDHAEAHNSLGVAHGKLNKYHEAIVDFQQAVRIRPEYAEAHNNMGLVFETLDRSDAAIKAYNQAIEIDNEYFAAHYNLGNLYLMKGDFSRAITPLKTAARLRPEEQYKTLKKLDREKAESLFTIIYEDPIPEK